MPKLPGPTRWPALVFLIYQAVLIFVLVGVMLTLTGTGADSYPDYIWDHVLPLWVPWAGALGGATISLVGVAGHGAEWAGPQYAYWHLARPLLGAISATVSVLILLFVLRGVDPDVVPTAADGLDAAGTAVLVVIAFVVGYREETFRELVKRVVDVILGPGEKEASERLSLEPDVTTLSFPAAGGVPDVSAEVRLRNETKQSLDVAAAVVTPGHAQFAAAWVSIAPLPPGESRGLNVTWTPPAGAPVEASTVLTVALGGSTVSATIRGVVV
jgi:hypothetical protein